MYIVGVGDCKLVGVLVFEDFCFFFLVIKKKGLREKEKFLYLFWLNVGEVFYDKDVIYVDINDY